MQIDTRAEEYYTQNLFSSITRHRKNKIQIYVILKIINGWFTNKFFNSSKT